MALAGIKEGRQSRYKTTSLLIILILFSVFRQFGKLEFIYAFANIPYLLVVHRPHKLGGHNCQ